MTVENSLNKISSIGIPADLLVHPEDGQGYGALYPKRASGKHIIRTVSKLLGFVSHRHLARLLDCPDLGYVSRWYYGRARPSPVYLGRMLLLISIYSDGIDFTKIRYIDWQTGEPRLESKDPSPSEVRNLKRSIRSAMRPEQRAPWDYPGWGNVKPKPNLFGPNS